MIIMDNVLDFMRAAAPWIALGLMVAILAVRAASYKKKGEKYSGDYGSEGMCLGMSLGAALGSSFGDNTGLGLSLGMLIGLAIGSSFPKKPNDKDGGDEER